MTIDLDVLAQLPRLLAQLQAQVERLERPDRFLKTREAAALLRIGESELLNLVHAGAIPHLRIGNGYRFSEQQLLEHMREQARQNLRQAS